MPADHQDYPVENTQNAWLTTDDRRTLPVADQTKAARKRIIVADPRSFVRGCLSCWLEEFGSEFLPVVVAGVVDAGDAGSTAAAAVLSASGSEAGQIWLKDQVTELRARSPHLPILAILDSIDSAAGQNLVTGLELQGYIPMSNSLEVAAAALRLVIAGGCYYPQVPAFSTSAAPASSVAPAAARNRNDLTGPGGKLHLTPREYAVFELLAKGLPNKIIAHQLGLAISTVKIHVHHIIEKLNVQNRTEVAIWGRDGLPTGLLARPAAAPAFEPAGNQL